VLEARVERNGKQPLVARSADTTHGDKVRPHRSPSPPGSLPRKELVNDS